MNKFKKLISSLSTTAFAAILILTFTACSEQTPLQPSDKSTEHSVTMLAKGKPGSDNSEYNYPLSTYGEFQKNNKGNFQGGQMKIENGTTFSLSNNSLTPPEGWTGEQITLTMEVDMDPANNEMLFTFGPSGCTFNPPAVVWFNYGDLGVSAPKLYYIDSNGNYIEQVPESIDYRGNKMMLSIDHFSRYAIGLD